MGKQQAILPEYVALSGTQHLAAGCGVNGRGLNRGRENVRAVSLTQSISKVGGGMFSCTEALPAFLFEREMPYKT